MKRYFLITLITGQTYELLFDKVFTGFVPLVPPNNHAFLKAACALSQEGFMEPGTDARPRWINPSQIKHIEVVFEESKMKVE